MATRERQRGLNEAIRYGRRYNDAAVDASMEMADRAAIFQFDYEQSEGGFDAAGDRGFCHSSYYLLLSPCVSTYFLP